MAQHQGFGVTATSDGLTTGLIPAHAFVENMIVTITSAAADNIVTLPAVADVPDGSSCRFYIGANGCEVRTVAASGSTINSSDSDGTNEAAIPATHYFEAIKMYSTGYLLIGYTEAGVIATITPDGA